MTPQRTADEISKNVSCPDHQQQVQQKKCARPLLANLHQESQGESNVAEGKYRNDCGRKCSTKIKATHSDYKEDKRSDGSSKSRVVDKYRGREQRFIAPGINRQQHEE